MPVLLSVGAVFLVTGAMLAALPMHVRLTLGYGADMVGAIAGAQFVAGLACRVWSGRVADRAGPRRASLIGLTLASASGLACLGSALPGLPVGLALGWLFLSRVLLGAAESFVITASQSWGLVLAGRLRAAAVIGWTGTAIYVALSAGGPVGGWINQQAGFAGLGWLTLILPATLVPLILRQPDARHAQLPLAEAAPILRHVLRPGLAAGLAGFAYAAIAFFAGLLALDRGWPLAWMPLSAFALGLIGVRLIGGDLPDRLGVLATLRLSVLVVVAGLGGLALAPGPGLAALCALLAGAGYALIYPALGREAVSHVPLQASGRAIAWFSACLDLTLGLAGVMLGLIARHVGIAAVFWIAALACVGALAVMSVPRRT